MTVYNYCDKENELLTEAEDKKFTIKVDTTINNDLYDELEEVISNDPEEIFDDQTLEDWNNFALNVEVAIEKIGNIVNHSFSKYENSVSQYFDFYVNDSNGKKIPGLIDLRLSNHKQTDSGRKLRKLKAKKIDTDVSFISVIVNDKQFDSYDDALNYIKKLLENLTIKESLIEAEEETFDNTSTIDEPKEDIDDELTFEKDTATSTEEILVDDPEESERKVKIDWVDNNIWNGKTGVIVWEDPNDTSDLGIVTVRITDFPTQDGFQEVEQNFERRYVKDYIEEEPESTSEEISEFTDENTSEPIENDNIELDDNEPALEALNEDKKEYYYNYDVLCHEYYKGGVIQTGEEAYASSYDELCKNILDNWHYDDELETVEEYGPVSIQVNYTDDPDFSDDPDVFVSDESDVNCEDAYAELDSLDLDPENYNYYKQALDELCKNDKLANKYGHSYRSIQDVLDDARSCVDLNSDNDDIDDEYIEQLTEDKKDDICCICGAQIIGYGNNAAPVADGVCCDDCNINKVIPARLNATKSDELFRVTKVDFSGYEEYEYFDDEEDAKNYAISVFDEGEGGNKIVAIQKVDAADNDRVLDEILVLDAEDPNSYEHLKEYPDEDFKEYNDFGEFDDSTPEF